MIEGGSKIFIYAVRPSWPLKSEEIHLIGLFCFSYNDEILEEYKEMYFAAMRSNFPFSIKKNGGK
jgi:hypothetical protein